MLTPQVSSWFVTFYAPSMLAHFLYIKFLFSFTKYMFYFLLFYFAFTQIKLPYSWIHLVYSIRRRAAGDIDKSSDGQNGWTANSVSKWNWTNTATKSACINSIFVSNQLFRLLSPSFSLTLFFSYAISSFRSHFHKMYRIGRTVVRNFHLPNLLNNKKQKFDVILYRYIRSM